MNKTILVVGSKSDFESYVYKQINKKDFVYLTYELDSLCGVNLKDVIFLKNWGKYYGNKIELFARILSCFRGTGFNEETLKVIEFGLEVYTTIGSNDYEEKIRIEQKVKKEYRDKEMGEWNRAVFFCIILFIAFIVFAKSCGG